jgi:cobalt-zinc-cadmium efflux system protein
VTALHDLHIWPLSTSTVALTAHLVMPKGGGDTFLLGIAAELKAHFGIDHATLQVEHDAHDCPLISVHARA